MQVVGLIVLGATCYAAGEWLARNMLGRSSDVERERSRAFRVVDASYEKSQWPMIPKEVIYRAVDGGWKNFDGNLGPGAILDLTFFEALATGIARNERKNDMHINIETLTHDLAHAAYDFYLHYFQEPANDQQAAVVEFWDNLLKP